MLTFVIDDSVIAPLISGLVAITVAILAANFQRRENVIATRMRAYERLEGAIADWAKCKLNTQADVINAANIVRLVGSEKTSRLAARLAEQINNHPTYMQGEALAEFQQIRLSLMKSMRKDLRLKDSQVSLKDAK